jgi:hypothetical protein
MPFVLITIGAVLFVTAINGTYPAFGKQLYSDVFTSNPSFIKWAVALVAVGFIGYIPNAKKPADWFMFLIIVGMVLANGGFFTKLQQAIAAGPSAPGSTGTSGATGSTTAAPTSLLSQIQGLPNTLLTQGLLSTPLGSNLFLTQAANAGIGNDTPNLTDADFNGLTDADITG